MSYPKTSKLPVVPKAGNSIRRRIGHMLAGFGFQDAPDWPEAHPVDLDALQLVELSLNIEAEFDVDFRDDLIPPHPNMGDFVDMVEAALRQTVVDRQDKRRDVFSDKKVSS